MAKSDSERGKIGKKYHLEMSRASVFLWSAGLFVLLAWTFALGVFAGRGLIPGGAQTLVELKAQIARLQQMVSKKDRTQLEEIRKLQRDPKFAFFDELAAKKDEREKQTVKQEAKGSAQPNPAQGTVKPTPQAAEKAPPGTSTYVVQIASLETEAKAKEMVTRLTRKGFPAYFYKVVVKGKAYYRVRCGVFKTEAEAVGVTRRLAEKEKLKGVVQKADGH